MAALVRIIAGILFVLNSAALTVFAAFNHKLHVLVLLAINIFANAILFSILCNLL